MATLMYDLAAFTRAEGAPIDRALRNKMPHLRFTFDRFAGSRGDALLVQLFGSDDDIAPKLRSAAQKLRSDPDMGSVATVIEQLCDMASSNQLSGAPLQGIAQLAGETGQMPTAETLLDPEKLSFSHIAGNALRQGFQRVLQRGPDLSPEERETLEVFVVATSNIEQLLSMYFTRYQDGTAADRKNYLYLAWMLWAFLRVRSGRLGPRAQSIYSQLPRIGADVITFNYTNFFDGVMLSRVKFFHGRLDQYFRLDTRELVKDDSQLRAAVDVDRVTAFIDGRRLDVMGHPAIDIPAIVPPTSFKPVMSRDQLLVWVEADELLQQADIVAVIGYSFAQADEHFNDLVRKTNRRTRILIVNPDLDRAAKAGCGLLGVTLDTLARAETNGFDTLQSHRLTCLKASAADVTSELLDAALG